MDNSSQEIMSTFVNDGPLFYEDPDPVSDRAVTISSHDRNEPYCTDENVPAYSNGNAGLVSQSRALERKTNDAALKRAMLGREEAESEMRRYHEEVRGLRKLVEDGKARERKVGERLETVMENYGKAKETHVHSQTLWEKEIKKSRKEAFKSQSVIVKLQGELQTARSAARTAETNIAQERARTKKREEEAFAARYQLVGVQEELANTIERLKLLEQERDALKTVVKEEEIARIAAEGQLPLPLSAHDDEFGSPMKVSSRQLPSAFITSSASAEEEIDQLKRDILWATRNAEKAHEHIEFLQQECQFNCCSVRQERHVEDTAHNTTEIKIEKDIEAPQQRTVFDPAEGVFKIASLSPSPEESPWISPARPLPAKAPAAEHSRTPSCEPPPSALLGFQAAPQQQQQQPAEGNTSLLSLIDGSGPTPSEQHSSSSSDDVIVPTMSREEAIAKIRERRGRALSLAQDMVTPKKVAVHGGGGGRDFSAPAVRSAVRIGGRV